MQNIRVLIIGCGIVGMDIYTHSMGRGFEVVGAVDIKPELIGRDFGEISGIGKTGLVISGDAAKMVAITEADLAIVCTLNLVEEIYPEVKLCLEKGLDVITTSADAYYFDRTDTRIKREFDAMAKANGCSLYATGIQDVFWTSLPLALSGACRSIREIKGTNVAIVDDFGEAVADECYIGQTVEQFRAATAGSAEAPVDAFTVALYVLAEHLGYTVANEHRPLEPIIAKDDKYAKSINRHIKKGNLIGNTAITTLDTEEGVGISAYFYSKLREDGDTELNKWEITGEPNLSIVTEEMYGSITTGTSLINRMPDVINAAPGVVLASKLELPYFKAQNLSSYVK